jgi:hypothetical protein
MRKSLLSSAAHRYIEGGITYPTGHILAAFAEYDEAARLRHVLMAGGYGADECTLLTPADVIEAAQRELSAPTLLASLGYGLQARHEQLQLARDGHHFLLVHAPHHSDYEHMLRVLARTHVRYAVRYRSLVIEDITPQIAGATLPAHA